MDTRQLAAFCSVVERKSFSQAAAALGVTQPAVSLQIRSLEKRLGKQLLDRSGRRVEPTEDGLRLYRGARRLLALEEELLQYPLCSPTLTTVAIAIEIRITQNAGERSTRKTRIENRPYGRGVRSVDCSKGSRPSAACMLAKAM